MLIVIKITHYNMNLHNVRLTDTEIEDTIAGLKLLVSNLQIKIEYASDALDLSKIKGLEGQVQEIEALLSRLDTIYG